MPVWIGRRGGAWRVSPCSSELGKHRGQQVDHRGMAWGCFLRRLLWFAAPVVPLCVGLVLSVFPLCNFNMLLRLNHFSDYIFMECLVSLMASLAEVNVELRHQG